MFVSVFWNQNDQWSRAKCSSYTGIEEPEGEKVRSQRQKVMWKQIT